jgi:inhibitor of cysteine peptidase
MMRKTSIYSFLVTVVLLTSCSPKRASLTAIDNGGQVQVNAGDQLVIELEGNPSTGYNWEAQDLDTSMFKQVGEVVFTSANPGLVGSSGTLTLTYKILKTGTSTLSLIYHRSWETGVAPEDIFTVTVVAK